MSKRRAGFSPASFVPKWGTDILSGFVNAVVCVPNGLAMGSLAGVAPVAGLYSASVGPLTGSLLTSTHMMIVTTTSAAAVAAGQAVASVPAEQRLSAIYLVALVTGVFLLAFAALKADRLVKYIPSSVMQGFMFGVAAILVLDQFPAMVGYQPEAGNSVVALWETLTNPGAWEYQATIVGFLALILVAAIAQTKISKWSNIIALVVPTGLALALGWTAQQQVVDVSPIPSGLPPISLPDLALLNGNIIIGSLSLAAIITVQASGITATMKNPDGSRQNFKQDIVAQGGANVAVGLLSGIPVGASVGQSAFNRATGARTRMAIVFCGVWMFIFLLFLGSVIEQVPMAVLGALMVFAGFGAMNFIAVRSISRMGWLPTLSLLVTLVMTVLVSVPAAVATGVILSFVLNVVQRSGDVLVRAIQIDEEGRVVEVSPPKQLVEDEITALVVYGDLLFSGAKQLEETLPSTYGVKRAAVVIRLRGQGHAGATLVDVLAGYAAKLAENDGRLFLSGVSAKAAKQLSRSGRLSGDSPEVAMFVQHRELGRSTEQALQAARAWLAERDGRDEPQRFALRMVPVNEDGTLIDNMAQLSEQAGDLVATIPEEDRRTSTNVAYARDADEDDFPNDITHLRAGPRHSASDS